MKHQPEQLRAIIKTASDQKAESVALQTTMLYLDRMGFLHCAFCPQRFGLQRATIREDSPMHHREVYLCQKHYSEMNTLFHSNGNAPSTMEVV